MLVDYSEAMIDAERRLKLAHDEMNEEHYPAAQIHLREAIADVRVVLMWIANELEKKQ